VCWSIVVTKKSTVVSPFFGAILYDRIPKVTKTVKETVKQILDRSLEFKDVEASRFN
jgi:hypothetical protein